MKIVYLAVGFVVISNLGLITTIVISVVKLAAKFGKMEHQINENEKDVHAAHSKIRDIENAIINRLFKSQ